MFLRIKSAMVSKDLKRSYNLVPDDIVDWRGDKEARRLVKLDVAEELGNEKDAKGSASTLGRLVKVIAADPDFETRLHADTLETNSEVEAKKRNELYIDALRRGDMQAARAYAYREPGATGEAAMRAGPAFR